MKSRLSYLILGTLIFGIIVIGIALSEAKSEYFETDAEEHVFFAKWRSYLGYALYEEEGQIQLPFLEGIKNPINFKGEFTDEAIENIMLGGSGGILILRTNKYNLPLLI